MSSKNKKARVGLAVEVELALPFLSITEDFPHFAAVSKAWRDAAREEYQERTTTTTKLPWIIIPPSTNNNNVHGGSDDRPKFHPAGNVPLCWLKPWWKRQYDYDHFSMMFRESNCHPLETSY